jgi:hypothetical protein
MHFEARIETTTFYKTFYLLLHAGFDTGFAIAQPYSTSDISLTTH